MNKREILIAIAVKNGGDYQKILADLYSSHIPEDEEAHLICSKLKCNVLTFLDPEYPEYLKHLFRPPFVLFYHGDISLIEKPINCLAVVGTREPSGIYASATEEIVKECCKDYIIVSGLAKGIDRIAHKTAIDNGGRTIAILGSGINVCYPIENEDIYKDIINSKKHLLISEYPPNSPPDSTHFPFRNRLIAMFSKGILVTESAIRSGSSITVNYGLDFGRDIMCLPSSNFNQSGCNQFLKQGAACVENAIDVYNVMDTKKLL